MWWKWAALCVLGCGDGSGSSGPPPTCTETVGHVAELCAWDDEERERITGLRCGCSEEGRGRWIDCAAPAETCEEARACACSETLAP